MLCVRRRAVACGAFVAATLPTVAAPASNDEPQLPGGEGAYLRMLAGAAVGRGVRLNNPYRLETQLGDDERSLSLTAWYADLAFGVATGDPNGLQHGGMLSLSIALDGVPQEVLVPAYLAVHRIGSSGIAFGRVGLPVIIEPDANVGGELGVGAGYRLLAGYAATLQLVGNVFYGAATREVDVTTIPVISLQVGIMADYEVLP